MEKPRLILCQLPDCCNELIPDTIFQLGANQVIDNYIGSIVAHLFPGRKVSVEYILNTSGNYGSDLTCITCLTDGGALFLTNIGEETKKYKEFDDNCIVSVASAKQGNVILCLPNKCIVGFGVVRTLDIRVSDGETILQANDEYTFNEIDSRVLAVPDRLNFDFFNNLIYHSKSLIPYDKIIENNGLYQLSELDTSDKDVKQIIKKLSEMPSFNRFSQRLVLPNVLTTTTCDWISHEMKDNRSEIQLAPKISEHLCKYIEFIIDKQLVVELCLFYNISLELFAIDIVNIMRRDTHGSDKRDSQFSMDIGLEDGLYRFEDGTKQSFRKGDCIVYLNSTRNSEEKVLYKVFTIEFNIRPKKMNMKTVL